MAFRIAKWPFLFVVDSHQHGIGWAVVNSRIVKPSRHEQFAQLRRLGFRFLGMCSDVSFPKIDEADSLDYDAVCEAWCHCFRDPDSYLPLHTPRVLLSSSDFTDYRSIAPDRISNDDSNEIDFDFVYVGPTEG